MRDLLFEHQRRLGPELVIELTTILELDLLRFEQDVSETRIIDQIEQDVASGLRSGVEGTTTFYIDGFCTTPSRSFYEDVRAEELPVLGGKRVRFIACRRLRPAWKAAESA